MLCGSELSLLELVLSLQHFSLIYCRVLGFDYDIFFLFDFSQLTALFNVNEVRLDVI